MFDNQIAETSLPATGNTEISKRTVTAGLAGIFVELYENVIYGFLASTLALVFFPNDTPATALLLTFVAFGIPFFARPVGAAIGGHWGDKIGRRTVLVALIITMSGATGLIGVLPSASTIGVLARSSWSRCGSCRASRWGQRPASATPTWARALRRASAVRS
ncbi:hypothetical protein P9139_08155 [Curtobacterium flaccumfaciens]|nr:hypothetical protein P9139_08155 [Curtobacterium flaccumfaciens]